MTGVQTCALPISFYCEKHHSKLIVLPQKDKIVSIFIDDDDESSEINLTINDAKKLIDEINNTITILEGGNHE